MLKSDGHLVSCFNPWAVTNWNELWAEFTRRLIEALDEMKINVEGMSKVKRRLIWQQVQQSNRTAFRPKRCFQGDG
jgi:hypothetical protein